MDMRLLGWTLLISGFLVGGYAALFGIGSWEVTLAFVIFGFADAIIGAVLVMRSRLDA